MTRSNILSFLCGAAAVLAVTMVVGQSRAQAPNHVYELRVYHANPGKLDAVNARFRDHTDEIFKKHGIKSIGYFMPEDQKLNEFIYVVDHKSKEDADKNWKAFQADPEWIKVRDASEANGKLVDHVDSTYMDPTTYSKMK
ncbi:MAG TPA: NIPSNAP family protein [Bryobacteraceae bacterium]|nr:NIPSNAP family protein [Bryobacteraceae bacterium]